MMLIALGNQRLDWDLMFKQTALICFIAFAQFSFGAIQASNSQSLPADNSLELDIANVTVIDKVGRDRHHQFHLEFELTGTSKAAFGSFTIRHTGSKVELLSGGKVLMAPIIIEPILGGALSMFGNFSRIEAEQLKTLIEQSSKLTVRLAMDRQSECAKPLLPPDISQGLERDEMCEFYDDAMPSP